VWWFSVDRGRTGAIWLLEVSIANTEPGLPSLIDAQQGAVVGDVEQVDSQTESRSSVIRSVIHMVSKCRSSSSCQGPACGRTVRGVIRAERNLTRILISRNGEQVVDGTPVWKCTRYHGQAFAWFPLER